MYQYVVGAVAAIGGAKYLHDRATTSTHDWILRKAFKQANRHASDDASLYVDHVNDDVDADGHCAGVLDTERVPDLIVSDFAGQSLVVEVEDSAALERDPDDAAAQLSAFATQGYKRLLVTNDPELGEQVLDNHDLDSVEVATASEVSQHV